MGASHEPFAQPIATELKDVASSLAQATADASTVELDQTSVRAQNRIYHPVLAQQPVRQA